MRDVLVATDFSEGCRKALKTALDLAISDLATLALLHVTEHEGGEVRPVDTSKERARLDAAGQRAVEMLLERGDVAETIVRTAQQRLSSLIVMGLHREPPRLASHVGWTTVHRVVVEALCAVLTLACGPAREDRAAVAGYVRATPASCSFGWAKP